MTTASTLIHSLALSACLAIQAVPGAVERPSGIRRALQTMDKSTALLIPRLPPRPTLTVSNPSLAISNT